MPVTSLPHRHNPRGHPSCPSPTWRGWTGLGTFPMTSAASTVILTTTTTALYTAHRELCFLEITFVDLRTVSSHFSENFFFCRRCKTIEHCYIATASQAYPAGSSPSLPSKLVIRLFSPPHSPRLHRQFERHTSLERPFKHFPLGITTETLTIFLRRLSQTCKDGHQQSPPLLHAM